jgi:hypothetical protein
MCLQESRLNYRMQRYALLDVLPHAGSLLQRSPEMTRLAALIPERNEMRDSKCIRMKATKKAGEQARLPNRAQACQRRAGRIRLRLEQRRCNRARVRRYQTKIWKASNQTERRCNLGKTLCLMLSSFA